MRLAYKQLSFSRYAYAGEDQCLSPDGDNDDNDGDDNNNNNNNNNNGGGDDDDDAVRRIGFEGPCG